MRRLILPFLPLLAAFLVHQVGGSQWLEAPALESIQRVILSVVVLLAWRLRRGRVAWIALALAAVAEVPDFFTGGLGEDAGADLDAGAGLNASILLASLWLVIDLAAASMLGEWWFLSQPGLWRLGILAAQALSVAGLAAASPETRQAFLALDDGWSAAGSMLERLPAHPIPFEPLFWATLGLAFLIAAAAYLKRRSPLEAGFLVSLVATGAAFGFDGGLRFYFAAAGLVLAVALVENAFSLAFTDGLTGLPARRALEERLEQLGRHYTLAMLDLDHFKKLNDRHGHEVGDQVLKLVASRLRKAPGGGEAFRYGGEEFTIVFAGQSAEEASVYLDALRQQIASRPFIVRSPGRPAKKPAQTSESRPKLIEKSLKVTVSIGVAERSEKAPTPETVMKSADRALYKSKKAGRNRVSIG